MMKVLTYPVYIVLKLPWKIQVHDMCNTLHIKASTGHICGDKYLQTHYAVSRPGITAALLSISAAGRQAITMIGTKHCEQAGIESSWDHFRMLTNLCPHSLKKLQHIMVITVKLMWT